MVSWIKMRTDLYDDPKVRFLAKELKCHVVSAIGSLYVLWSMADQYTTDGTLWTYTAADIDKRVGREGFAKACASKEIDWLDVHSDRIVIKRFDEHNGESAKARAQTAKRVQKLRKQDGTVTPTPLPEKNRRDKNTLSAEADGANGHEVKTRKDPTGPHHDLIRFFAGEWQKRYGAKFVIGKDERGKDCTAFKTILDRCERDLGRAKLIVANFIADADPYVADRKHPVAMILPRFNQYNAQAESAPSLLTTTRKDATL